MFYSLVKNKNWLILIFTIFYLIAFTFNAFAQHNFEFLYYTILMTALIYIIVAVNKQLHLAFFILVNLSILGFLHLLGGNFYLANIRLYDFFVVQGVIRYDNIIHTYGTFIATLTLYSLFSDFIDKRVKQQPSIFSFMLVLMATGIGAANEVLEFFAVVFLGAQEQVGGYFNNALDLVFNILGSILACVVIYIYQNWQKPSNWQQRFDF